MFGEILNKVETPELTLENIKTQKDTAIVKTLTGYFTDIRDVILDKNGSLFKGIKPGKAGKNRDIRVALARIDGAIEKRFGIRVKTLDSSSTTLAIMTTPPNTVTMLSGDVPKKQETIKEILRDMGESGNVTHKDLDARTANWVQILKANRTSIDAIDRKLEASSITIDMANAKVYGFPKSATPIVVANFVELFDKINLTPAELAACYLHEIGHEFTHLEYSHTSVKNLRILVDSLIEEAGNNGRAPLEALKISYSKVADDEGVSEAKTIPTAVLGITSRFVESSKLYGGNTYAGKDSERLADQFVVRFGAGKDLTTALDKFEAYGDSPFAALRSVGTAMLIYWVLTIVLTILSPALGILVFLVGGVVVSSMLYITIFGYIFYLLVSMVGGLLDRGIDTSMPYDSPKRRVLRMRNELIRKLRMEEHSKEEELAILSSLELMEASAERLSDYDEGVYYRIVGKFFSYSGEQHELRDIDKAIDDLTNNQLHVAAAKLATVKGV